MACEGAGDVSYMFIRVVFGSVNIGARSRVVLYSPFGNTCFLAGQFQWTEAISAEILQSSNSVGYNSGGIYLRDSYGSITIGGESSSNKNIICGNYKDGSSPFLDQQIRDDSGDLYEIYKDTNYISAYCE